MKNTVYCLAKTEPQANEALIHLRNLGFTASDISVLLKKRETRNMSMKEDAIRGAETGGLAGGALGALAGATVLAVPVLGPILVAGPILAALGGAAVGGVVGGLVGGSGALIHIGIPKDVASRMEARLHQGAILIAVHSNNPIRLDKALRVFKSSGAEEIHSSEEDLAA